MEDRIKALEFAVAVIAIVALIALSGSILALAGVQTT